MLLSVVIVAAALLSHGQRSVQYAHMQDVKCGFVEHVFVQETGAPLQVQVGLCDKPTPEVLGRQLPCPRRCQHAASAATALDVACPPPTSL